jgi:hypothetical protein
MQTLGRSHFFVEVRSMRLDFLHAEDIRMLGAGPGQKAPCAMPNEYR